MDNKIQEQRNRSKSKKKGIKVSLTPSKINQSCQNSSNDFSKSSIKPINQLPIVHVVNQPIMISASKPGTKITFNYTSPIPQTSSVSQIESQWIPSATKKQSPISLKKQNIIAAKQFTNTIKNENSYKKYEFQSIRSNRFQQNSDKVTKIQQQQTSILQDNKNYKAYQEKTHNVGFSDQQSIKTLKKVQYLQIESQKQLNKKDNSIQKNQQQSVQVALKNESKNIEIKDKLQIRPSVFNIVQEISYKIQNSPIKKQKSSQSTIIKHEKTKKQVQNKKNDIQISKKIKQKVSSLQKIEQKSQQSSATIVKNQTNTKDSINILQSVENTKSFVTQHSNQHPREQKVNIQRIRQAQQRLRNIIRVCDYGLQN